MAWSYRPDRTDEIYSDTVGVTQVSGKKLPHTPASPEHAKEMLNPPKHKDGPKNDEPKKPVEHPKGAPAKK